MNFFKSLLIIVPALTFAGLAQAQTAPSEAPQSVDFPAGPIASTGHHVLFDPQGRTIDPSKAALEAWLAREIKSALDAVEDNSRDRSDELTRLAADLDVEEPIANSILLGRLAEERLIPNAARIEQLNHVVREHWYRRTLDRFDGGFDGNVALPSETARKALELGLIGRISRARDDVPGGAEYRSLCRESGVPVPPNWVVESGGKRGDWDYEGDLKTNFLRFGEPTEVWSYRSSQPRGTCIALPRFDDPSLIGATGIICLGLDTGNACFYDKPNMAVNQDHPIDTFQAGATLMGGGICSDCHAGENPFVVHPSEPLNLGSAIRSPRWHTPLVKADWPQNPGPSHLLDQLTLLPGQRECKGCHVASFAGRFPDVLELNRQNPAGLSGYCRRVVEGALNGVIWEGVSQGPTMGTSVADGMIVKDPAFDQHRDAMLAFCQQEPAPPTTVPVPDDDREVVSPPLLGPLYACATFVEVRGTHFGAEIILTINSSDEFSTTAESSESVQFEVPTLNEGDVVEALQIVDGQPSDAAVTTVISHLVDYPDGLPRPEIDPTLVHQCGHVIAVRHVKGATVTVTANGADPRSFTSGGDWTNVRPSKSPFDLNDSFRATQQLCEDVSDASNMVSAVAPPSPMPVPRVEPTPPLEGQPYLGIYSLANGALTKVDEQSAGQVAEFSTAVDWDPEVNVASDLGRTIVAGDSFRITSSLCEGSEVETDKTRPCETLPAPTIAQPFVGDTTVTVTSYVPGARILVFGDGGAKIGDGAGTQIGLIRAIQQGETLTVAQRLQDCVSNEAYQIAAICVSTTDCDF